MLKIRRVITSLCITLLVLFVSCQHDIQEQTVGKHVDFGNLHAISLSDVVKDIHFVELETTDESLFGTIDQMVCYEDKIYILDTYKTNSLLIFSKQGKFISKLGRGSGGPEEFFSPHSFVVNTSGIYILDRQLSKVLHYGLDNLKFKRSIKLPYPAPLSFTMLNEETFIYFYPLREKQQTKYQYIKADATGHILEEFYEGSPSGKILHGNPANFYWQGDLLRTYPYFSNTIYEFNPSGIHECYHLKWGDMQMPEERLFTKYETSDPGPIMEEILRGEKDWIRLLYVYETENILAVKYYIKRDLYLSAWDKHTNKAINVKADKITDDLGLGEKFPLPFTCIGNHFIATIDLANYDKISHKDLKRITSHKNGDSNPILLFYQLEIN